VVRWFMIAARIAGLPSKIVSDGAAAPLSCSCITSSRARPPLCAPSAK